MWLIILGVTISLYLISNLVLLDGIALYLLQPLIWLCFALFLQKYVRSSIRGKSSAKSIIFASALVGTLHVVSHIWTGVFTSFGQSPYLHTPLYLVVNTLFFASQLIGIEVSRAALLHVWKKSHPTFWMGFVTFVYAGLSLSFAQMMRVELGPLPLATFLISLGLPALAESFLATYLALLGGPVAAIAYRGILSAFEWYSPLLPNPPLAIRAFISVMIPVIGFLMINEAAAPSLLRRIGILTSTRKHRARRASKSSTTGWIAVSAICVIAVWASTGLLGFYPSTVISGSMSPAIGVGDLAIIVPVDPTTLQVGDIIQYRIDDVGVLHRIVSIATPDTSLLFMTKGDTNYDPDPDPVFPTQIQGKLLLTVPKIGWLVIYLKTIIGALWTILTTNPVLIGGITVIIPVGMYVLRGTRKKRFQR